jgi:hypothetical protein
MLTAMSTSVRRSRLPIWLSSLLAVACATTPPAERPGRLEATKPRAVHVPPARPAAGLYAADEALHDALSSPLRYLATGRWPGIRRTYACAFRNDRVLVVNVYCSPTETQAFRVDVYSPERGRVRIYAESKGTVSEHTRPDYYTFTAESEPPPGPEWRIPPLALSMSFPELRDYDERRYNAFLPACYGGTELNHQRGGCLGTLEGHANEWAQRNRAFLEHASDDWYRVVRELRELAARYGKEPDDPH